jgi:hypothetical protein
MDDLGHFCRRYCAFRYVAEPGDVAVNCGFRISHKEEYFPLRIAALPKCDDNDVALRKIADISDGV